MLNQVRGNLHTVLAVVFVAGVLFFAGNTSLVSAQGLPVGGDASSLQQLQELISKLRAQLSLLNENAGTSSATLKIGSAIETTDILRVRTAPSPTAPYLGTQQPGAKGVVIEGPIRAGGHTWLKVNYETGVDGWNAAGWLKQKASYAGEVENATTCIYERKTYTAGEKEEMSLGTSTEKATFECISGRWRLDTSERGATYIFSDTQSIKKQKVYSTRTPAEDVYTLYTIVLKNGTMHKVKVFENRPTQNKINEASFRKTGYVGSIKYLTDRAQAMTDLEIVTDPKPIATTTPISDPRPTPRPEPKPIAKACISDGKTYKEGDTVTSITIDGKTKTISDSSFVCRNNVWIVVGNPNPKPIPVPVVVKKPTCTVIASDTAITFGSQVRLTWTASDAVSGTLNKGIGEIDPDNADGFREVKPTTDTTYVMTVKNSKGEQATCSKKVLVTPKPVPTPVPTPKPAPESLVDAVCVNSGIGYKLGEKAISLNIGGEKITMSGQWFVCNKFKGWTTVRDSQYDSIRYFVYDVKTITKQSTANNETIFKIVLENGKTHTIKVAGTCEDQKCYREFAKTGYAGYMSWILEKAKVINATPVVKGASTNIFSEIETTLATIALLLKESK